MSRHSSFASHGSWVQSCAQNSALQDFGGFSRLWVHTSFLIRYGRLMPGLRLFQGSDILKFLLLPDPALMTDWSYCYPLSPTDCTAPRPGSSTMTNWPYCYPLSPTAKPDPTQHNRYIHDSFYCTFLANAEVPPSNNKIRMPREALELTNLFISLELIPKKFPSLCRSRSTA